MKLLIFQSSLQTPPVNTGQAIASVIIENDALKIDAQNTEIKGMLEKFMSTPIIARRPVGKERGILAFKEIHLSPGTEEFLREAVYALRIMGFTAKLEGVQKPYLIALDFDGVLWDSVHECFVVGRIAYERIGRSFPSTRMAEKLFRSGRPFCKTGEDFYVVFRTLEDRPATDFKRLNSEMFEELRKEYKDDSSRYESVFYEERSRMIQKDPDGWAALQSPYPGILGEIDILQKTYQYVAIATTKDEASAKFLLAKHHLSLDIVAKEISCDKIKQMHHLSEKHKMPLEHIIFIDDLLEQVLHVRSIGVAIALASWGYNTEEQREQAKKTGIPLLEIANLHTQIQSLLKTE